MTANRSEVVLYTTGPDWSRQAIQFCADRLRLPLDKAEDLIRATIAEMGMKVELPELVIPRSN